MSRIPYYEVENATGKHAEFLGKLKPHLNIYRMLANSENGMKGFIRMGNALLHRCELEAALRELAILRVGRLSRTAYEVFQHERIAREAASPRRRSRPCAMPPSRRQPSPTAKRPCCATPTTWCATSRPRTRTLKAVQAFLTPGAVVELTLTIGYYMMVCRCSRPPASRARKARRSG
jgi:alkylhydroperoxidase family enzyme